MSDQLHEVEAEVKELAHEADEGKTARTPFLLVGGVGLVVGAVVVILLVVSFLAYYLS